jgi:hypothetical protein
MRYLRCEPGASRGGPPVRVVRRSDDSVGGGPPWVRSDSATAGLRDRRRRRGRDRSPTVSSAVSPAGWTARRGAGPPPSRHAGPGPVGRAPVPPPTRREGLHKKCDASPKLRSLRRRAPGPARISGDSQTSGHADSDADHDEATRVSDTGPHRGPLTSHDERARETTADDRQCAARPLTTRTLARHRRCRGDSPVPVTLPTSSGPSQRRAPCRPVREAVVSSRFDSSTRTRCGGRRREPERWPSVYIVAPTVTWESAPAAISSHMVTACPRPTVFLHSSVVAPGRRRY